MPEYARRVNLSVAIDGHDVAGHFAPYLLDFTYTDNASGKADEVRLTLHNRDGQFTGAWKPRKGMPIEAAIICEHWQEQGRELQLPCGSFKIDEIEFSGPPDKVQIKAVSADLTGPLRDTRKTRAWENMSLEELAGQIAGENGLKLYYSGPEHKFERQDQRNEGDIAFLNRLCGERSMHCKVHSGHLVVFDADEAESAGAALSIPKTGGIYSPTSYSFKMSSSGTDYKSADVAYTDPKTGTTHKAKVKSAKKTDTTDSSGKTLTLNRRVENASQAMALGKSELRKANSKEQTASLEIMGCPLLAAGQMLELTGFGDFSGKYFIKTATHKISGSGGYKTSLELSAPAPTEAGSAHDEVNEAAIEARQSLGAKQTEALNEEADKKAKNGFEELLQRLPEALSEIEELLLCLPEIAAAEAGRTTDKADKQGWLYLEKMFYRWFGGKANEDGNSNPDYFWIDRNWALKFPKAREKYNIRSVGIENIEI